MSQEVNVHTTSCGCCDHGCCCQLHMDLPRGRRAKVCGIHQLVSHPRATLTQRVWLERELPPPKITK